MHTFSILFTCLFACLFLFVLLFVLLHFVFHLSILKFKCMFDNFFNITVIICTAALGGGEIAGSSYMVGEIKITYSLFSCRLLYWIYNTAHHMRIPFELQATMWCCSSVCSSKKLHTFVCFYLTSASVLLDNCCSLSSTIKVQFNGCIYGYSR